MPFWASRCDLSRFVGRLWSSGRGPSKLLGHFGRHGVIPFAFLAWRCLWGVQVFLGFAVDTPGPASVLIWALDWVRIQICCYPAPQSKTQRPQAVPTPPSKITGRAGGKIRSHTPLGNWEKMIAEVMPTSIPEPFPWGRLTVAFRACNTMDAGNKQCSEGPDPGFTAWGVGYRV